MAKKRKTAGSKSWLMPEADVEAAAKSSIEKTSPPKVTEKAETPKPAPATVKSVVKKAATKPATTTKPKSKVKQKPGPKGLGEDLKICRLTTSAHKLARKMAFETEETLTEYLSRLVKADYDKNYNK